MLLLPAPISFTNFSSYTIIQESLYEQGNVLLLNIRQCQKGAFMYLKTQAYLHGTIMITYVSNCNCRLRIREDDPNGLRDSALNEFEGFSCINAKAVWVSWKDNVIKVGFGHVYMEQLVVSKPGVYGVLNKINHVSIRRDRDIDVTFTIIDSKYQDFYLVSYIYYITYRYAALYKQY